jgi:glycosyltransferase involved in cell wall biosynthesis
MREHLAHQSTPEGPYVALLTGGGDRPYALGLASSLVAEGLTIDFIGSDDLRAPQVCEDPRVRFLNLRGDQRPEAPLGVKAWRLFVYYARLIWYALTSRAPIFHILWNNRVEWFDRVVLPLLYRARGKRIVLTLHNVNREARDGRDSVWNRLTLKWQYRLSHHLFVHTEKMKAELVRGYDVQVEKIGVIPFGINGTVPNTTLSTAKARQLLDLPESAKVLLFFGNIAPYKGLDFLVDAFARVADEEPDCHLIIAGRPKPDSYWTRINAQLQTLGLNERVTRRIEYVRDEDTEIYFKAADVLALPYVNVFQSGVLFLAYNFGLPVIATDVATMREDIEEGVTGFVSEPENAEALAAAIRKYFGSPLYLDLPQRRATIQRLGQERHSWATVGRVTRLVYCSLLERTSSHGVQESF